MGLTEPKPMWSLIADCGAQGLRLPLPSMGLGNSGGAMSKEEDRRYYNWELHYWNEEIEAKQRRYITIGITLYVIGIGVAGVSLGMFQFGPIGVFNIVQIVVATLAVALLVYIPIGLFVTWLSYQLAW